jgi:N-acetylglutamate synthase
VQHARPTLAKVGPMPTPSIAAAPSDVTKGPGMSAAALPSADDVGRRVVVRRVLDEAERGDRGERLTDVVGILERLDDDSVVVRRRDEESVRVPLASVVAFKVIPARAVPHRDVRALESAAAMAWRGVERAWLGEWQLRAAAGFTGRANSCLPIGDPGVPLLSAVDAVSEWYVARSLPPRFQLPSRLTEELDRLLQARGWASDSETIVITGTTATVLDTVSVVPTAPYSVVVKDDLDDAWLSLYRGQRALPPVARLVLADAAGVVGFAQAYVDDRVAAIGRGAVTAEPAGRRWLGLTAVEVLPPYRRRGLARGVVRALTEWGVRHDAGEVYLQVSAGNKPALRLSEGLGLTEHHRYHYRRASGA